VTLQALTYSSPLPKHYADDPTMDFDPLKLPMPKMNEKVLSDDEKALMRYLFENGAKNPCKEVRLRLMSMELCRGPSKQFR
jgi:hypothetical protein